VEDPHSSSQGEEERRAEALVDVMTGGHALRHRIFSMIADRVGGTSIREVAERVGEPERRVRHHVEALLASGLIELDREEERRGAVVRYYRAERMPLIWSNEERLSIDQLERLGTEVLRFLLTDVSDAIRHGTLARGDSQIYGRIRRRLDRRGCLEVKEIHERALAEAERTARASAERAAAGDKETVEMVSAILMFEVPNLGP
jgi:DNA-binding transcriptional ArsR family regulator